MTVTESESDPWQASALPSAPRRPPWCPTPEDGAFLLEALNPVLAAAEGDPTLLVLGVTPETLRLDWPKRTKLVAVDSSPTMISSCWRPHPDLPSQVVCAPWQEMPLTDRSIDAAVGDGSLNALPEFDHFGPVLKEVARVLRPRALLVLRCFLKQGPVLQPSEVVAAAMEGHFPTTAAFRLPFLLSLAGERTGLGLAEVPRAFDALVPDRDRLAAAAGWPRTDIDRIDWDVGSPIRLTFPTRAELESVVAPWFEVRAHRFGHYTQAACCPTVVLQRRD